MISNDLLCTVFPVGTTAFTALGITLKQRKYGTDEPTDLDSRGREIPRHQSELSSQTDDAPRHPLLQAQRQTMLLRQGRTGGVDEECPRGIAGGTRPTGTEVHHQPRETVGHGRHIRLHQPVLGGSGAQPVQPYGGGTVPLPPV